MGFFSAPISSASELESSLMSFAASDSTSTWQRGIKEREDGEKVWGDDYSRKAINQGTAIIRGNTVFLLYPDCTYLARTKILAMLGTGSLLAEVSHFPFIFASSDHKHKIMDRPFMPNYGVVSQVLLQLVVAGKVLGTFWKSQKLILSGKNQWVVIAKNSFRKTEKFTNAQKMNSRKNFVPHGMPT